MHTAKPNKLEKQYGVGAKRVTAVCTPWNKIARVKVLVSKFKNKSKERVPHLTFILAPYADFGVTSVIGCQLKGRVECEMVTIQIIRCY